MASIRIEHIGNGDLTVVKDFSLSVDDGEFVVLVGPSGCGESTTLKIVAGLEPANSGQAHIGACDVTDLAPGDRDIAMVFQNYALYPHLTVRKNMAFGLRMRRMDKALVERRVGGAAKILGLEHLLDRRPRALSGGQRQRVALGRAIVREPQALLMDEPLSNLDAKLRVQMRAEIGALHQRLGVTHDQVEAMTMADRIVIMRDGDIHQIADPDTMFAKPANLFVAGFMGSPAMNFLKTALLQDVSELHSETVRPGSTPAHRPGTSEQSRRPRGDSRAATGAHQGRRGRRDRRGHAAADREPRKREIYLFRRSRRKPHAGLHSGGSA
jgi:multiple sugar transport system ATP-binding protein